MFIMQNNESRLIKAAKRTIRAEVTLVVVIIVISSWSIYALYKLAYSSDILSNIINFSTKPARTTNSSEPPTPLPAGHLVEGDPASGDQHIGYYRAGSSNQILNYSQPETAAQYRARLLQELMAGQQELYANLGATFQSPIQFSNSHRPFVRQTIIADTLDPQQQASKQQLRQKLLEFNGASKTGLRNSQDGLRSAGPTPPYLAQTERPDMIGRAIEPTLVRQSDADKSHDATDREVAESNNDPGESIQQPNDDSISQVGDETEAQNMDSSSIDEPSDQSNEDSPQVESRDAGDGDQTEQQYSGTNEGGEPDQQTGSKESGVTIDDEVDRISQPSLRHHQSTGPDDYVKNTVQFDDLLSNNVASSNNHKSIPAGSQIARFEDPRQQRNGSREAQDQSAQDLQFDHNSPVAGSAKSDAPNDKSSETVLNESSKVIKKRGKKVNIRDPPKPEDNIKDSQITKRILEKHLLPVESNHNRAKKRAKRSTLDQMLNHGDSILASESSSSLSSAKLPDKNQRSDDGDDAKPTMFSIADGHYPMPSYLTTNDSVLQELIDRRRLLDALKASQLPAPYIIDEPINEPEKAGSRHHVDHGLILFPSAGELHENKAGKKSASASKKRGKHVQMKDKRKVSSASKKGGHKGRRLDKEEKKFLKEKKFKGAKKGKKVSKGKGGAGGKKGKKLYKDKGYKKKGFKNVYHKEEWANKKSFFDEYRDKDFKKKWKKFDDKYNYAQMKKFQAKDEKGAKKLKHHNEDFKKYDKGKWRKNSQDQSKEHKELLKKKKKKTHEFE